MQSVKSKVPVTALSPEGDSLPVLLLLIEFSYNGEKSTDEGVAGIVLVGLDSQKVAPPFCINKFLLQFHILLAEEHQVLFQLGHLLCKAHSVTTRPRHAYLCLASAGNLTMRLHMLFNYNTPRKVSPLPHT